MIEWSCAKERINERGSYMLVEWSFAKERINEREPHNLVEWSCTNKRNKSMRSIILDRMVAHKRKIK